ncbi:MAG: hypothetical protein U9M95_04630 [Candidatus Altiarchaeota archaeon]|nr:hypothetical protein [Candidatus Altiarchaeota archaeon]
MISEINSKRFNEIMEWCRDWDLPEPDSEFTGTSLIVTLWKSKLIGQLGVK